MFWRFAAMWLIIIGVASYDTYLTAKHAPVMEDVEINPVGVAVLQAGGVPSLIGMKTCGVALALLFCVALWQHEQLRKKVLLSSYCVATLSLGLVCYMSVDIVGIQTHGWAREMEASIMAANQAQASQTAAQPWRTAVRDSKLAKPVRPNSTGIPALIGTESAGAVLSPSRNGVAASDEAPLMAAFEKSEIRTTTDPSAGKSQHAGASSVSL